jgi:hypothetical protein
MNWNNSNIFDVPDKNVEIRPCAGGVCKTGSQAWHLSLKFSARLSIGLPDSFEPPLKYALPHTLNSYRR